jgi:maleate isomerase
VVERIEEAIGKPVVTANQAMLWRALRLSGCNQPVEGYGALLRLTD